jgi:hypothetical protein
MEGGTMAKFVGYDPNGIARVYAEHPNIDVAETWVIEEIWRYLRDRPDLRPFNAWLISRVQRAPTRGIT